MPIVDVDRQLRLKAGVVDLGAFALIATLTTVPARIRRRLGIPACCGGYWGSDKASVVRMTRETGILFNLESHAEKSVDEVRKAIDFGAGGRAVGAVPAVARGAAAR